MNFEYDKRIGANIRAARKDRGLSQEQLAARLQVEDCDVTRSALAKIEVGQRHIYVDEIILLKKILSISFDELLK